MILWGILAAATGVVRSAPLLLVDRFLLGIVESAVFPGLLILISHWFTKGERSRANTRLILGNPVTVLWMSVMSGYLVQAFGWQWTFIVEGLVEVIWAPIWWWGVGIYGFIIWLPTILKEMFGGPFFAIITEMLPRSVAGGAMALVNSMGALGSFVGTYVVGWLNGVTGGPDASFLFMAVTLLVATVLMIAVKTVRAEKAAAE